MYIFFTDFKIFISDFNMLLCVYGVRFDGFFLYFIFLNFLMKILLVNIIKIFYRYVYFEDGVGVIC